MHTSILHNDFIAESRIKLGHNWQYYKGNNYFTASRCTNCGAFLWEYEGKDDSYIDITGEYKCRYSLKDDLKNELLSCNNIILREVLE